MLGGLLLTVGLLTPIVAALIGCGATAFAFFLTPFCTFTIFEGNLSVIFGAVILLGVVLLGPGALPSAGHKLFLPRLGNPLVPASKVRAIHSIAGCILLRDPAF
jgi:hypothetical protein